MKNMQHGASYPDAGHVVRDRNTASAAYHVKQTGGEKSVLLGITSPLVVLIYVMHKFGWRGTHPHARIIVT